MPGSRKIWYAQFSVSGNGVYQDLSWGPRAVIAGLRVSA
jgi:hypothetical protein